MEIRVVGGDIQDIADELIVVNLFEGIESPGGASGAVDRAMGGVLAEAIAAGDVRGKKGETTVFYTRAAIPAPRVLVVGLGPRDKFTLQTVREVAASAACKARDLGVKSFSSILHGAGSGGLVPGDAAQAIVEGTILGLYRYRELKNEPPDRPDPEQFTFSNSKYGMLDKAGLPLALENRANSGTSHARGC